MEHRLKKWLQCLVVLAPLVYIAILINADTNHLSSCLGKLSPQVGLVKIGPNGNKTLQTPSVYLSVFGGLGNQLFEYACSYSLARKHGLPLYLHVPLKQNRSFASNERPFVLDHFELDGHTEVDDSWTIPANKRELVDRDLLSEPLHNPTSILKTHTCCQSENFFVHYREEILAQFEMKMELIQSSAVAIWKTQIQNDPASVALHIRRGDFSNLLRQVSVKFYEDAVSLMTSKLSPVIPTFYIFTDEPDVDKLRTEFQFLFNSTTNIKVHLVSDSKETNSIQEFYLMKSCKHQIIPGSSYGWWAAYLNSNTEKVVICAHYNPEFFDSNYKDQPSEAIYYKFQFRNFYYPIEWFAMNAFNATSK